MSLSRFDYQDPVWMRRAVAIGHGDFEMNFETDILRCGRCGETYSQEELQAGLHCFVTLCSGQLARERLAEAVTAEKQRRAFNKAILGPTLFEEVSKEPLRAYAGHGRTLYILDDPHKPETADRADGRAAWDAACGRLPAPEEPALPALPFKP